MVNRTDPRMVADEREMLDEWLDYHRATLLLKCEGLDDAQLRQWACPPSNLSLLGLVRHMTEVERSWFLRRAAGRTLEETPRLYYSPENPDGDFEDVDDTSPADVFAAYEKALGEARAVAAGLSLTDTFTLEGEPCSLRWVYVHMIEEYARHNGHADLLRERLDGVKGD